MEPVLWNRLHFLYRSGKIVRMNTSIDISHIRNFSIVAHIDHGKSTISDRILELTHTVDERDMESQLLDTMDIERERGITIKSNAVRVSYDADDGETYQFNLIDTPGHVDFTYEVSRSLAACEGAVLVVDATQGVEAQTVSNATLAMNANLDIVPAINKIDLPSAHPDEVKTEIEDDLAIPADDAVCVSGKTGEGIHDLLESIVFLISPPKGDANAPLKALILDSYFDEYRGVVATVRIFDGSIKKGDTLRMMQAKGDFLVDGVGVKRPAETPVDALTVGEVGYVVTGLKDPEAVRVGDTLTWRRIPAPSRFPATARPSPWSIRACSRSITRTTRTCVTRSISCTSTTRRWYGSPRPRWRSALASAWASWACCTWKSLRNAWSASSTWTSLPRVPRSTITSTRPTAR